MGFAEPGWPPAPGGLMPHGLPTLDLNDGSGWPPLAYGSLETRNAALRARLAMRGVKEINSTSSVFNPAETNIVLGKDGEASFFHAESGFRLWKYQPPEEVGVCCPPEGRWTLYINGYASHYDNMSDRNQSVRYHLAGGDYRVSGGTLQAQVIWMTSAEEEMLTADVVHHSTDFSADVAATFDEAQRVFLKKHKDYGPKNITDSPGGPLNGLRVRLYDKLARLNHLVETGADPENEALRDSLLDIANYGIIGMMVLDGRWPE